MPFEQSPQMRDVAPSPTLAMNERVRRLRSEGRDVYQFGFGESRFPPHPRLLAALREHAADTSYPPVAGFPELREAIAAFYRREFGIDARPDRVIVGPGSKSLIYALLHVLDGDLLLHRPAWVSYAPYAQMLGKQVVWLDTRIEDEYCLTADTLAAGIARARDEGHDPRILLINSPGNPTGVTYPEALVADLAERAREYGLTVISDEIYAMQAYPHRPHVSIARYYPEGTAVTGGVSKQLSLGGWRFGCAVLPPTEAGGAMMRPLTAVAGNIWSSPAAPVQHAATVAYGDDADVRTYVQTCSEVHRLVTEALYEQLWQADVPCPRPSGAYYLYPSFDPWKDVLQEHHGVTTSDELAALLLEESGIASLPGTVFGSRPADLFLRLATSYLYAENETQAAATLDAYRKLGASEEFLQTACPAVFEVGRRVRAFVDILGQ